jgi:hypothetical protein
MNWRTNIAGADRFWGCLPYLLPLIEITAPLTILMSLMPALLPLRWFLQLMSPVVQLYGAIVGPVPLRLGSFVVFLLMYLAVVQNPRIGYSVRFNTLQSILLSVVLSLWAMVGEYLFPPLGTMGLGLVGLCLMLSIPLAVLGVSLYAIGMTACGRYADIPKFSENVYLMLPR